MFTWHGRFFRKLTTRDIVLFDWWCVSFGTCDNLIPSALQKSQVRLKWNMSKQYARLSIKKQGQIILLVQFGVYFPILRMHAFNTWSITNTRGAPFPFDDILKLAPLIKGAMVFRCWKLLFIPSSGGCCCWKRIFVDYTGKPFLNLSNSVIQKGKHGLFYQEARQIK